ncbi:MAG: hypothetical protein PHD88_08285 [Firmicutes bacterium]|nr:hypothetical protein [Bacillota bacterium]MDD4694374.1 hypothetical protein [Bacillota bacterium]
MKNDPRQMNNQLENGVELTMFHDDLKEPSTREKALLIGETVLKYLKPRTYTKPNNRR